MLSLTHGRLSAMMLGRLQMTVTDALNQYKVVATHVFGSRNRRKMTLGGTRVPKYKDENLEEALRVVTQRDRLDIQPRSTSTSESSEILESAEDVARRAKNVRLANGNANAARTQVHPAHAYEMLTNNSQELSLRMAPILEAQLGR